MNQAQARVARTLLSAKCARMTSPNHPARQKWMLTAARAGRILFGLDCFARTEAPGFDAAVTNRKEMCHDSP